MTDSVDSKTYVDLRHYIERLIQHEHELVETRLDASAAALEKAEHAMTLRLEGMNEFRRQLEQQEYRYAQRGDLVALQEKMELRLTQLEKAESIMTGKTAMLWLVIVFGMAVAGLIIKVL